MLLYLYWQYEQTTWNSTPPPPTVLHPIITTLYNMASVVHV